MDHPTNNHTTNEPKYSRSLVYNRQTHTELISSGIGNNKSSRKNYSAANQPVCIDTMSNSDLFATFAMQSGENDNHFERELQQQQPKFWHFLSAAIRAGYMLGTYYENAATDAQHHYFNAINHGHINDDWN